MADVIHVEHGDGTHSLGIEVDGDYIPFASVSGARVEQIRERAATLRERIEQGDEEAKKAAESSPFEVARPDKGERESNGNVEQTEELS